MFIRLLLISACVAATYFSELEDGEIETLSRSHKRRKRHREGQDGLRRNSDYPAWYNRDLEEVNIISRGLDSILSHLGSSLVPAVTRFPLRMMAEDSEDAASKISADIKFMKVLLSEDLQDSVTMRSSMERKMQSDSTWGAWNNSVVNLLIMGNSARFDEGDFLENLSPFVRLHVEIVKFVFRSWSEFVTSLKKYPLIEELSSDFPAGSVSFPSLYLPFVGEIVPETFRSFFDRLLPQVSSLWPSLRDRYLNSLRYQLDTVKALLEELELLVSQVMNQEGVVDTSQQEIFKDLLCPDLIKVSAFVSWVPPENIRRSNRLIVSLFRICSESTAVDFDKKHKMISYLPEVIRNQSYFAKKTFRVSSLRDSMLELSKPLLERGNEIFPSNIIVKFTDTRAEGDNGPRAQWLSVMFEYYFKAGNGIFEYSDDSNRFLKPCAKASFKALSAVGRLIGISIRHGITVGAKLTPCSLALLRLPSKSFDLEKCVKAEDPLFYSGVKKIELAFAWDDQEAAEMLLQSLPDSHDLTQTSYPEYIHERLYEKGVGSIRKQMAHVSRAIQSVIPQAALELFTDQEFETMINGVDELPGDSLWNGIHFKVTSIETQIKQWLEEIIHEENEAFRFAFNRFVTGAAQPPVNLNDPWIFATVNFSATLDSLPTAQTCFRNILIPNYLSKETLRDKLLLAVFHGVSTLELY